MSDGPDRDSRWNETTEGQLRELWDFRDERGSPHTTADIAEIMFGSRELKNAIIGKAHRLKLPRRCNPIIRHTAGWTQDRLEQWKRMRTMGYSQHTIAKALGISQSWLHKSGIRLGLGGVDVARASSDRGIFVTLPSLKSLEASVPPVKRAPVPAPPVKPAVPLFKPESYGRCNWVTGKRCYCNEPITQRGPYCDEHRALAYRENPRRALAEVA